LVDSYGGVLVLYARQWCTSPDDALQEALIDLTQLTNAPRDPVAWLFKVVRNKSINQSRGQQRRDYYQRQAAQERDIWFDCDPVDTLQSGELEALLGELEPLAREIIVARIWGDLPFEKIAELVERPLSTVHRQYKQTLKLLEAQLNGQIKKS
jgi:RNA polymerase sigma-70 factor (ECF subfamily)